MIWFHLSYFQMLMNARSFLTFVATDVSTLVVDIRVPALRERKVLIMERCVYRWPTTCIITNLIYFYKGLSRQARHGHAHKSN